MSERAGVLAQLSRTWSAERSLTGLLCPWPQCTLYRGSSLLRIAEHFRSTPANDIDYMLSQVATAIRVCHCNDHVTSRLS
jgi:hypothetical protein